MKNNRIVTFFIIVIAILIILSPFAIMWQSQDKKDTAMHEANSLMFELKSEIKSELDFDKLHVYPPLKNIIFELIRKYSKKIPIKAFALYESGNDNRVLYSYIMPDVVNKTPWTLAEGLKLDSFKHAEKFGSLKKRNTDLSLYIAFEYQSDLQIRNYFVQGIAFAAAILIMALFLMIFTPRKRKAIVIKKNGSDTTRAYSGKLASTDSNTENPFIIKDVTRNSEEEKKTDTTIKEQSDLFVPTTTSEKIDERQFNTSDHKTAEAVPDSPSDTIKETPLTTPSPNLDDIEIEEINNIRDEVDIETEVELSSESNDISDDDKVEDFDFEGIDVDFETEATDTSQKNEEIPGETENNISLGIDGFELDDDQPFLSPTLSHSKNLNTQAITELDIEVQEPQFQIKDELSEKDAPNAASTIESTTDVSESEETETQSEAMNHTASKSDSMGLFSPYSGLCRADYLQKRLTLELERAAYSDQDLCLIFMKFPEMNKNDASYKKIAGEILNRLAFEDLCFETDEEDTFAVILPNNDLDQAITSIEDFAENEPSKDCKAGISSRNGRLVDGSRMIFEAKAALLRSNSSTPIVGFKPDPGKYRTFISSSQ